MPCPKYKMDFEMDTCYEIKQDIETEMNENSKIILYASATTNRGSVIFLKDTLDERQAMAEGISTITAFVNSLLMLMNRENMAALRFGKLELLNPDEFEGQTRTLSKSFSVDCVIVAPLNGDNLKKMAKVAKKLNRLNAGTQEIVLRTLAWLRKAAETSGEEKFIYRWISLEALCGMAATTSSTPKMLNDLISHYLKMDTAKAVFERNNQTIDDLAKSNIAGWHNRKPSADLVAAINKGENRKVLLCRAVLCVYEVRNGLFHKGDLSRLLDGCSQFLRDLTNSILTDILSI